MDLIEMLTQQVGINQDQAENGLGMLLQQLKGGLDQADFEKIAEQIPNANALADQAPAPQEASGLGGLMGKMGSLVGGKAASLGGLAALMGGFKNLGLSTEALSKFVATVTDYLKEKGGPQVAGLVEGLLK